MRRLTVSELRRTSLKKQTNLKRLPMLTRVKLETRRLEAEQVYQDISRQQQLLELICASSNPVEKKNTSSITEDGEVAHALGRDVALVTHLAATRAQRTN